MRVADKWLDYKLLDTYSGEKLERWGDITLVRPDPQIIWKSEKMSDVWDNADGHYRRSKSGGGSWPSRPLQPGSICRMEQSAL